ncbi:MAG TPA: hypothetical protein VHT52_05580 [Stellaceae bacterium]|nr:hypothetical protein [Stellaceae bacterium]
MPESSTDRCTTAHEYLFHLTKSARYFYDGEAIKEPQVGDGRRRGCVSSAERGSATGRRRSERMFLLDRSILRPALRAPQPLVPLRYRRRGTVAFGHCSGFGLDLMTAFLAPHDKARTRRGGVDERRRRTGGGRHRPGRRSVEWRGPLPCVPTKVAFPPIAATQPSRRELLFLPRSGHCRAANQGSSAALLQLEPTH